MSKNFDSPIEIGFCGAIPDTSDVCVCGHIRKDHWGNKGQSNCTVGSCDCWYFLAPEEVAA